MARIADDEAFYAAAERRIEYLTLALGAAGAIVAAIFWRVSAGAGIAIGAFLSWVNFRWMRHGIDVLTRLSVAQGNAVKPRVAKMTYVKIIGRYALMIAIAYVILRGFGSLAEGLLFGLFAAIAAVVAEVVGQLFRTASIFAPASRGR
ncbi:MAG TPA: ATP synthase subunit I [Candidatus Acidoferrum sp.]|nr:ATP synthase subunit I [Candidatus Acidoferrum sp.]